MTILLGILFVVAALACGILLIFYGIRDGLIREKAGYKRPGYELHGRRQYEGKQARQYGVGAVFLGCFLIVMSILGFLDLVARL